METILLATLLAVLVITCGLDSELRLKVRAGRRHAVVNDAAHAVAAEHNHTAETDPDIHAATESMEQQFVNLMAALERIEHAIDQLPDKKDA